MGRPRKPASKQWRLRLSEAATSRNLRLHPRQDAERDRTIGRSSKNGDDHEYHVASPQVEAGNDRAQGQHDTQDMPQVPSPQVERNEGSQRE
jgi:hypothetical protein